MSTRIEIIAQIDSEISRLERARDYLVASLAESHTALTRKAKTKIPAKVRKQTEITAAAVQVAVAAPAPEPIPEPQIRRVPPKRRMERRQLSSEKAGNSGAALRGLVPAGPVAVSADEARKVQERAVQAAPAPIESVPISSERSLGSLIQAFERRAGLSGLETT